MFGSQETVHAVAYSYLNETLKLEDYEAFLHEPATAERFDNLVAYDGDDKRGIAKSLAVFLLSQKEFLYTLLLPFCIAFSYVIYLKVLANK